MRVIMASAIVGPVGPVPRWRVLSPSPRESALVASEARCQGPPEAVGVSRCVAPLILSEAM